MQALHFPPRTDQEQRVADPQRFIQKSETRRPLPMPESDHSQAKARAEAGFQNGFPHQIGIGGDHDLDHSDFLGTIAEIGAGQRQFLKFTLRTELCHRDLRGEPIDQQGIVRL